MHRHTVAPSAAIEDPVLALPLQVKDLLDGALADSAVAKALLARELPELVAPLRQQTIRAERAEADRATERLAGRSTRPATVRG